MNFENISIKAIAAGLLTDIVGSIMVGVFLGIILTIYLAGTGEVTPENLIALHASALPMLLGFVGASLFTLFGGYLAARISRPDGIVNSLAVGALSVLITLVLAAAMPGMTPPVETFAAVVLNIPLAWAGGKIATRSERQALYNT